MEWYLKTHIMSGNRSPAMHGRKDGIGQQKDFRLGLGVTAGITARKDMGNYIPLPIIFPLFQRVIKCERPVHLYSGTYNNGNVLFGWLRYNL